MSEPDAKGAPRGADGRFLRPTMHLCRNAAFALAPSGKEEAR